MLQDPKKNPLMWFHTSQFTETLNEDFNFFYNYRRLNLLLTNLVTPRESFRSTCLKHVLKTMKIFNFNQRFYLRSEPSHLT